MPKVSLLLLRCPCGHVLHALPDALGKKVTCVKCGRRSMVTAQNTRAVQKMVTQAPVRTTAPVMPTERKRLGEMMVDAGLVTRDELNAALEIQARDGGKLAETLIRQGCLNMRAFVDFLAKQPGVASIDIYSYNLSDAYVKLVPKRLALEHEVFPLDKLGNLLTVAMACPLDTEAIQELERITGLRIKPLLCSPGDIKSVITRYYPREEDVAAVKPPQPAPPLPSPHTADQKPSEPVENVFTAPPPVPVSAEPAPAVPSAFFLLDSEDEPEPESLPPQMPEAAVDQLDAGGIIDGWKALPSLWTTLARIRSVAASSTTQLSDVANIVSKDPSLAATILGEANNPAYGLPGAVKSIEAAILLIGTHRTYLVGLGAPLFDWRACETLFDYPTFWCEAMCCASIAEKMAETIGLPDTDRVYLGGLFHDIGRLVLFEVDRMRYARFDHNQPDKELIAAEERLMGMAHTEAGARLATRWRLPFEIIEAIQFHHSPADAQSARDVVAVVSAASMLAQADKPKGEAFDQTLDRCGAALGLLGLDRTKAERVIDEVMDAARTRILWAPMWSSLVGEATGFDD